MLPPKAGEGAFDTPFFNAKEEPLTVSAFKGRGVVLNFWATWCAPCVREMPALDRLAGKLKGLGIEVVAVSEDRKAGAVVPPFLKAHGIANLSPYYDDKGELSRKFGVDGLPTTVLIAANGREIGRVQGVLAWDTNDIASYFIRTLGPNGQTNP